MVKSMTGFGRAEISAEAFTATWEIKSVNSRFLDMKWRAPNFLRSLEGEWEKILRGVAGRGRVELYCNVRFTGGASAGLAFNAPQAGAMLDRLAEFAASRGLEFTPDVGRLLTVQALWQEPLEEPDEALAGTVAKALGEALVAWDRTRAQEGEALRADITARLETLRGLRDRIAERTPALPAEKMAVMRERLAQLLNGSGAAVSEDRLLQEAAVAADRLDVSEEMTRLATHLTRIGQVLAKGGEMGKRLDFLVQESFREINTCGNKAQDAEISQLVVDFKAELEKCREQIQNIE
ncbi:Conserved hypothetical protein CHP00255 [Desulfovibrio sp. X2]|uniref:YicC/YloC family endoribonuclease n=1 Tax=Desulfovibrio sp. X2 TaxID=941449 RepID=UPI000358C9FD|nr:YicC/YloC family endoribonuclease [Desulfovibrio sp. X2]EPR41452.1 Conserved hypothetical protein CHP00255 [Desulfovibrio sp. X2]